MTSLSFASAPLRCLIVEDQALIGMALEACLQDAGFQVAGLFRTRLNALEWLEAETPEVAIIDYKLEDGCCLELARALRSRRVPFLIYSGFRRLPDLAPEFHDVVWLEKPTDRSDLLRAVSNLATRQRS